MKTNNKDFIKQFDQKIPIYELVISLNINLKKTGKNFMGLCPFHQEKNPSFSVSSEKNLAFCMSCRKGGPPLKFYRQFKNISEEQALKELAQQFNLFLPTKHQTVKQTPVEQILQETNKYFQAALKYILKTPHIIHPTKEYLLKERKLNNYLIEEFGLGYAHNHSNALTQYLLQKGFQTKDLLASGVVAKQEETDKYYDFFRHRLIFPLTNERGLLVGFAGRLIEKKGNISNKYLFNKENSLFRKGNLLYRLFEHTKQIKQHQEIILCEGFFDVISFYQVGFKNVVAVMGTDLNHQQIKLLKSLSRQIIIAYDGDSAGLIATAKAAFNLNQKGFKVTILRMPLGIDPDQYIQQHQQQDSLQSHLLQKFQRDYVFSQIDESRQKKQDFNELKKYISQLLKFQTEENQRYYKKEIYIRYQIELPKDSQIQEMPDNIISYNSSMQKRRSLNPTNPLLININFILQEMHTSLNTLIQKQKTYININEFYILLEICLNSAYIPFIKKDIPHYYFHPDILKLMNKIEEYYICYPDTTGVDIDHFVKLYKDFLNNINSNLDIYNLLLEIKNNPLFKRKKIIKNQEDLEIFYLLLEITHKRQQQKELQLEIQTLSEEYFLTKIELITLTPEKFFQTALIKELKIQTIEKEIQNMLQQIRQLNYKISDNL